MIYLDNNASTKLDAQVAAAMDEAASIYGNPSSLHAEGRRARRVIEEAREEVARLVGAASEEIVFTSGGTEANALAIFGATIGRAGRLVSTAAEHPSVREAIALIARQRGCESIAIAPEPSGGLDSESLLAAVEPKTLLVSVMAANNEYGGLYPVAQLAPRVRERGVLFHTDLVQAAGRIPVNLRAWGVDLASVSAHKMHGPKGVGALFVRRGVQLEPHTPGGGQEKKLRAGTENTVGIVGFGVAARRARESRERDGAAIEALRDRFERLIGASVPGCRMVGAGSPRLPNTSAILFEGVPAEALLIRLDLEGIAASAGSACSSGTLSPSPAILSLGLSRSEAKQVVRFSLSRLTTQEEITRVAEILPRLVVDTRRAKVQAAQPVAEVVRR